MPRSVSLASHTASGRPILGRPETFLTSRALTSQHSRPHDSRRKKYGFQQAEAAYMTTRVTPGRSGGRPGPGSRRMSRQCCRPVARACRAGPSCGTRTQTMPDALAISIAATRATSSSACSVSSMSPLPLVSVIRHYQVSIRTG